MNQNHMRSGQGRTFRHIPNPYVTGPPLRLGSSVFVGRDDVFSFIQKNVSALEQSTILVLIGERRTGKTSTLRQLPARLNNPRYIPIYIDAQALGIDPGMENFFLDLAMAIADGLEDVGTSIERPTLAEMKDGPQSVFEQRFLPMVRKRIGDRILLLTIDEFGELGDRVRRGRLPREVFPYLRHLIQHGEQLAFIFSGTHKMEEMIGDYWSVLFNLARYKKVGFLDREDAVRLIREPVKPYGMLYDDLAINEILRFTGCHPYLTQSLCTILVNRCNEAHRSCVTVQDVRDATEELMETSRAHLTFLWNTSDREDRVVLSVLAELKEQSDRVAVAAVADHLRQRQLRLDPERIVQVAERLIGRDLLRSVPGDPPMFDFTAQLYAHWLRKYKSFSLVLKETIVEEEWQRAKRSIEDVLFTSGSIALEQLTTIPDPDRQFAWSRYIDTYRSEFDLVEAPLLRFRNQKGLSSLNEAWHRMVAATTARGTNEGTFDQCAEDIVEQLRLVGIQQMVFKPFPEHPRLLTFLLDTKLAFEDINLPPSIPLIFPRRLAIREEDVPEIRHLLHDQLSPSSSVALAVVADDDVSRQRTEDLLRQKLAAPYACDVVLVGLRELQHIAVAREPQAVLRRLVLSKVDLISVSPYVTTGAISDNIFFGREPELREIYQHIATVSYAVIGGRRIGKSSLLGRLHRIRLPAAGFRTVYHDCSSTPTYESFVNASIAKWQPEPPSDAPATFGDLVQSPPDDKPLVLLLDEADKLVPADRDREWQLFNTLRGLANSDRVQVVLSGERTLRDALQDPAGPLFNFANEILLGPLDFRAVEELVTRPMRQLEIELVDKSAMARRIYEFTSGHPNVVQRLCRRLIERLNEQSRRRITVDDVKAVTDDPRFQEEDFLGTYWERATPLEQILSLLMAQEAKSYRLQAVLDLLAAQDLKPEPEVVKAALDRLVDLRSILKRSQAGYEFAVKAFPRVLDKTTTAEDLLIILKSLYLKNPMELAE